MQAINQQNKDDSSKNMDKIVQILIDTLLQEPNKIQIQKETMKNSFYNSCRKILCEFLTRCFQQFYSNIKQSIDALKNIIKVKSHENEQTQQQQSQSQLYRAAYKAIYCVNLSQYVKKLEENNIKLLKLMHINKHENQFKVLQSHQFTNKQNRTVVNHNKGRSLSFQNRKKSNSKTDCLKNTGNKFRLFQSQNLAKWRKFPQQMKIMHSQTTSESFLLANTSKNFTKNNATYKLMNTNSDTFKTKKSTKLDKPKFRKPNKQTIKMSNTITIQQSTHNDQFQENLSEKSLSIQNKIGNQIPFKVENMEKVVEKKMDEIHTKLTNHLQSILKQIQQQKQKNKVDFVCQVEDNQNKQNRNKLVQNNGQYFVQQKLNKFQSNRQIEQQKQFEIKSNIKRQRIEYVKQFIKISKQVKLPITQSFIEIFRKLIKISNYTEFEQENIEEIGSINGIKQAKLEDIKKQVKKNLSMFEKLLKMEIPNQKKYKIQKYIDKCLNSVQILLFDLSPTNANQVTALRINELISIL